MPAKRPSSSSTSQLELGIRSRAKRVRKSPASTTNVDSPESTAEEQRKTAVSLAQWRLDMPGGEVFYVPKFVDDQASKNWYTQLDELDTWYHPKLKVYGKEVSQSRSIAAYATAETINVKYSGHQVIMHYTYPDVLAKIQGMVEEKLGVNFNHVMLNKYADGKEYIGKHRDTKENKMIASLSLGAERTFIFTPSRNCCGDPKPHSFALENGSLLVMQGDTQQFWRHEIPKESKVKEGRISLTFRQLDSG